MSERRKRMVVDLVAGRGATPASLIRDMAPTKRLTVTVLRGRMTPEESWFRLELSGAASAVDRFLFRFRKGVSILSSSGAAV